MKEQQTEIFERLKEERDNSEIYEIMKDRLSSDKLIFKQRVEDLKEEIKTIDQQYKKCRTINSSIEFMGFATTSKLNIAKQIASQKQKDDEEAFIENQEQLNQDKKNMEELKLEFAKKMIEKESLSQQNRGLKLEIFNLEEEEKEIKRVIKTEFTLKNEYRALRELDGFVELNGQLNKSVSRLRVLDEKDFDRKYPNGYSGLIDKIAIICDVRSIINYTRRAIEIQGQPLRSKRN